MQRPLHHYGYVHRPFTRVAALLTADPAAIVRPANVVAEDRVGAIMAGLRARVAGLELGREVRIEIGVPVPLGARALGLPLSWRDAAVPGLFPTMRGQLEVSALCADPPLTQVTFVGSYRPPLGLVGLATDLVLGHRLAEATIHAFVAAVVARVERRLDEPVGSRHAPPWGRASGPPATESHGPPAAARSLRGANRVVP